MKRVLIITYYWPPTGGSGVQRWLKTSKFLPEFGWEPVVYTPSNPEAITTDPSLLKEVPEDIEVLKTHIIEPYSIYRAFTKFTSLFKKGSRKEISQVNPISDTGKKSFTKRMALWLRANYFIPDPRFLWIVPSVNYLKKYIKEHPVDVIVSTGPPHSMHLIGQRLHKETGIKWVADFRDPWTKIFYFKHLPLCSWARKKHERLELGVLKEADAVITVSEQIKDEFIKMESAIRADISINNKYYVIPNGFDRDDFPSPAYEMEEGFNLVHTGLFSAEGNPLKLWKCLIELCQENEEFKKNLKIKLIGKTDQEIKSSAALLKVIDMGYLPHSEICAYQQRANVLLLPLRNEPEAKGILTGKYFEYLAAGRPILAFGPEDGALAESLSKTGNGKIFDWENESDLKEHIKELYKNRDKGLITSDQAQVEKFSRRFLAGEISNIFDKHSK